MDTLLHSRDKEKVKTVGFLRRTGSKKVKTVKLAAKVMASFLGGGM